VNVAETGRAEVAERYTTRAADLDKVSFKHDGGVSGVHKPPVTRYPHAAPKGFGEGIRMATVMPHKQGDVC
jgi:hypothetical protein